MTTNLTEPQKRAVETTEGAILVFAGAGSGKTRVITHRIAHLIEDMQVRPENILAVTFTNKAAREMRSRVALLLSQPDELKGLTICTFHALGLRIIRAEHELLGYPADFTVYSTYEQTELMKQVMEEQHISAERFNPQTLVAIVSKMKNNPDSLNDSAFLVGSLANGVAKRLFGPYNAALKARGAVDFDDLITGCVQLFKDNGDICKKYSSRYRYVMVDEYQDTNNAQFEFVKLLSSVHGNIFVVGDDDQSIYSWRGADIENILSFDRDFEKSTVIRLEENFRSTGEIVDYASKLISNNRKRAQKSCFANAKGAPGDGIERHRLPDEASEAEFVAETIDTWHSGGFRLSDVAVIVRANYQTSFFELAFKKHRLPYTIVGGQKFFENKEIKDILAYIRVLLNPADEINLRRIINYPARGIGNATIEKLTAVSRSRELKPGQILRDFGIFKPLFGSESKALGAFADLMQRLEAEIYKPDPAAFAIRLIDEIRLEAEVKKCAESEAAARVRLDNISAFVTAVSTDPNAGSCRSSREFFASFVNDAALAGDDEEEKGNGGVTIITAHSAKGLEFERVFVPGFYQGGFPNHRAIEEHNIEEERRLAYVAFTRAKRRLVITIPENVTFRGSRKSVKPSVFLDDAGYGRVEIKDDDDFNKKLLEMIEQMKKSHPGKD